MFIRGIMDISIVLATYKRSAVLQRTLESFSNLQCSSFIWDLWVVDNAGDFETEEVVKSWAEKLPVTYLVESKEGKNNALNRALIDVAGELIVFTDDDIIANSDWLQQMWDGAARWPKSKVFGGKIVADWPGSIPFWGNDHHLNQSLFALHFPFEEENIYGDGDFLPYGANMMIRKDIFSVGYRFNPDIGPRNVSIYRMGSETEFLQRLKNDGFTPVFLPNAIVKHQIRSQQLTPIGLRRRNFRIGYSAVNPDEKIQKKVFSCARYLWKELFLVQISRYKAFILNDPLKLFENTCYFWRIKGKIYAQRQYQGAVTESWLQRLIEVK